MSRLGTKKGVYHSGLVTATENGPVSIILTGDVLPSRNANLVGTVYFKVVGEEGEHYYNIETPEIKDLLSRQPRNMILEVVALGHGKDPSTHELSIRVAGAAPQQAAPQQQAAQSSKPAQQPQQQQSQPAPEPQMSQTDTRPRTIMNQSAQCFLAAAEIVGHAIDVFPFLKGAGPDACLAATKEMAATMMISQDKTAGIRPLRAKSSKWVLQESED